jgi:hypothetical protein
MSAAAQSDGAPESPATHTSFQAFGFPQKMVPQVAPSRGVNQLQKPSHHGQHGQEKRE